ncbi:hypothetical protein [Clostridium beijerinckii]|uniref:hypothetical protein n=1 Tax=Clostridium beijerinckii TaxID=1520 RepID=UPI00242D07DB|nr:hypothetical protein [Clostridium beijerinckii]MDG5854394.1 hypothetical protein [Clostridium beijerinckii]
MIIEAALLKLPEILTGYEDTDGLYEANIANLFAMAVLTELNARNIDNPLEKIQMEKRYSADKNIRCDMYLDFSKVIIKDRLSKYGVYQKNWIEFKYFGGINRNKGNETKSENAGSIVYDIFRLIKYTNKSNNEGIYAMCCFNNSIDKYLAFNKQNGNERTWLKNILKSGINKWEFDLDKEPNTIKKVFKGINKVKMKVTTRTTCFEPLEKNSLDAFWGYLIQIIDGEFID